MSNENPYWTATRASIDTEEDLSQFKNWRTVRSIPIYKDNECPVPYSTEVEYMLARRPTDEVERWKRCLREPFLGHTEQSYARAQWPVFTDTPATTWTLKSAHHVLTYEALSGRSVLDYDRIVEFGAGIGETARLILDLGFAGSYHILDLPEIARISGHYLHGRAQVHTDLADVPTGGRTLFIATWSLSEVPIEYRNTVVSRFAGADFLIIFQNEIFEYQNRDYFERVFPAVSGTSIRMHPIVWHTGAKGNWYVAATGDPVPPSSDDLPPLNTHRVRTTAHTLSRLPQAVLRRARRYLGR